MRSSARGFRVALTAALVAGLGGCGASAAHAQVGADEFLNAADARHDVARVWSTHGNHKLTIILPPYGADQNFYNASRMPALLAKRGIDFAVLFTETTGFNQDTDIARLDALITRLLSNHGYDKSKVALGGFSAGGYGAFRYALFGLQGKPLALRPAALISVDAP